MSSESERPGDDVVGVVVHRNQPRRAVEVVERLLEDHAVIEVIVVDNKSRPTERAALVASLPARTRVLEVAVNSGFGPGVNAGVALALASTDAPYIVAAAHDAVFDPSSVTLLRAHLLAGDGRGAVSADVGDRSSPVIDPFLGALTKPWEQQSGFEATEYPHGTLLMFSRRFLMEIGVFDPRYFAYCEEADLGLRASAGGWTVGIARDVPVFNPQMTSNAAIIDYLQLRNTLLLLRTHFGRWNASFRLAVALYELVRGLALPGTREPFFSARARLMAIADHLRRRYGPPPPELWR